MLKKNLFIIGLIFISGVIYAQSNQNISSTSGWSANLGVDFETPDFFYNGHPRYNIGVHYNSDNDYQTTGRTLRSFNMGSLPTNIVVQSVILECTVANYDQSKSNCNYTVVQGPDNWTSWEDLFNKIGNAQSLGTKKYSEVSSIDIKDLVTDAILNGSLVYFGAYANDESTVGTFANVSMQIKVTYFQNVSYTIQNNFSGGLVYVQTPSISGSNKAAPYSFTALTGQTVTLGAIDNQSDGSGYTCVWNDTEAPNNHSSWNKTIGVNVSYVGTSSTINFSSNYDDNYATYEAQLKKICNVTYSANVSGNFLVGPSYRNENIPFATSAVEGNGTESVYAPGLYPDGYFYAIFAKWSDGSTSNPKTITPSAHTTITAYYKLQPTNGYRNLYFNSTIGDPITLTWSEHPSSGVGSYKIYRKPYGQSETLIATVNRGSSTHTYVDYDYLVTENTGPESRISYDVRAVYSGQLPDATNYTTEADMYFQMQFGEIAPSVQNKNNVSAQLVPTEYQISAYPNPFNPTTVIRYSMPEAGEVTLKVYNLLSQEVASLVSETKAAGVHTVNFNAGNLPSGIYIARLQSGSKIMSVKLQLVK